MRTRLMTVSMTAFALAGTLGLGAQAPQTQPPSPQPTSPTTSDTERQRPATRDAATTNQAVTVTGCLKAEKDVAGHATAKDDDFVLTDVKMGPGASTSAIGLAPMYEVKGVSDSELKKHLNHQVEITGTLESSRGGSSMGTTPSATGAGSTTAAGATTGSTMSGTSQRAGSTSGSSSDLPDLHGTSVKMIAATCSAQ